MGISVRSACLSSNLGSTAKTVFLLSLAPWYVVGDSRVYAVAMLDAHNAERARVGTPALAWSEELSHRAQDWAVNLINRKIFVPRRDGALGENLYEISGGSATPHGVVTAWASEQAAYHYDTNTCSGRCGHFTQVVWRETRRVGCGVARDRSREVWVCNYSPPGNIVGERPY
jgi:pathogenesis-related protein 1